MPVRSSQTSASAASSPAAAFDEVTVNRASPLTARARPSPFSGFTTSPRIPAAPIVMVRSADIAAWPSGLTFNSPAP